MVSLDSMAVTFRSFHIFMSWVAVFVYQLLFFLPKARQKSNMCWTCYDLHSALLFRTINIYVFFYIIMFIKSSKLLRVKRKCHICLLSCGWEAWAYIEIQYLAVCLHYMLSCLCRHQAGQCSSPLQSEWWWWWWFWWCQGRAASILVPTQQRLCLTPNYLHFLWWPAPLPSLEMLLLSLWWAPPLLPLLPFLMLMLKVRWTPPLFPLLPLVIQMLKVRWTPPPFPLLPLVMLMLKVWLLTVLHWN